MNKINLERVAEELLDDFFKAGKIAKEISRQGVKITIKKDNTPVTDGDIKVNQILTDKIRNLTPEVPIVSEETVDIAVEEKNKTFWLIDPIDGTKEYIKKGSEYTLNAALIVDLNPVLGVIFAPEKNRLFFSFGKNSAFEISDGKRKALNCRKKEVDETVALVNSDKTHPQILDIHKENKVTKIIQMSSSYKFCALAAGEADIYAAQARAFEWDIAAGHAILNHAGGSVTTHDYKNFLYGKKNYKNLPIIARRARDLGN